MISRLLTLLRTARSAETRRRLAMFALSGALAVVVGFVSVKPSVAQKLIAAGGYYFMLGVFSLFVCYAHRVAQPRRVVWQGWLRRPGRAGLVLAAATVFAVWADPFKHKILYDEYVLQGTAWHMHATKEIGTPMRAYDISGTWLAIDTFLDKRDYAFTFLLSLLHDFTGFRVANAFALNVALAAISLGLLYWLAHAFTGRRGPALLAVGLLATLPLFAQNATGAGMEMHNLAMIGLVMALALLYLRAPDDDRLALLILGAVLLALSRYESVLFVVPVALVVALGWLRAGRVLLPWPALLAPLLLVPYAWHSRAVAATPILWQLREGETARFSLGYLAGNLAGAWRFFFSGSPGQSSSWWFTVLGVSGVVWALAAAWRRIRASANPPRPLAPGPIVLIAFGAGIAANLSLLMFYYWSHLDEPIASRFALPAYFLFALLAAWFVNDLDARRLPATRFAAFGLVIWLCVWGAPAFARRLYTSENLVMQELDWELELITARPGPLLLISNKATMPFLLVHIPVVNMPAGRARTRQIAWHVHEGTFHEVLVAQALRPTSARGDLGVDPEDVLPENFHLETIAEKRFGGRWDRLSRVVHIDPEPLTSGESDSGSAPHHDEAAEAIAVAKPAS